MSVIINPIEQYFDLDGSPLTDGYLYFGEVYGNPVTQPVMVYFDADFTTPAAQPVRTVNGYPVRSGTATGLYAPEDVSILVQNSKKEQVIYIESSAFNAGAENNIYRDSNTIITFDDNDKTFLCTGTFTQTFDACTALGSAWSIKYVNIGSGSITLNPNLSELIDGQATKVILPRQSCYIKSDGVGLSTTLTPDVELRPVNDNSSKIANTTYVDRAATSKIQSITASVASNALTVGLNPATIDFRSPTLTNGVPNTRTIGSTLTLTVPSGATLGTVNAIESELYIIAIDNSGTVELAITNASGGLNLLETGVISTTAISVGATSASVVYSNTSRTNVPYRVIGLVKSTQATAGTWATAPSLIAGSGGNSLNSMMSLGYGQTWQNVLASRSIGVTYYNTTARPIMVAIGGAINSGASFGLVLNVQGVAIGGPYNSTTAVGASGSVVSAIVPIGGQYSVSSIGGAPVTYWNELR